MSTHLRDKHYKAADTLQTVIASLVYKVKRDSYICDFILIVYTGVIYNNFSEDLTIFICCELVMIPLVAFVQYTLLAGKGKFVNALAVDVWVAEDYITVRTSPFNGPLWFKKNAIEMQLLKADTKLYLLNNPYPYIFKEDSQVLKLESNGKHLFILSEQFNPRLEEELRGR